LWVKSAAKEAAIMRISKLVPLAIVVVIVALAAACASSKEESPSDLQLSFSGQTAPVEQGGGTDAMSRSEMAPGMPAPEPAGKTAPVTGSNPGADVTVDSQAIDDRKIVYNANLNMAVGDVDRAVGDVQRIAASAGGFLGNANVRIEGNREEERKIADIAIRVPSSAYQDVLAQLRGLATEVKAETAQSRDVTEEYSDLSARLRNLEATEARYIQLLSEARNIGEILQVQDRINATRLEIERIQGRLNLLDHLAELASITVHLEPALAAADASNGGSGWDPVRVADNAWEALLAVLRGMASVAIAIAIFSVLVVPLLVACAWLWRRFGVARTQA
jgi:hypothetical protein